MSLLGVVLNGGQSSRMGVSKGDLRLGDETLIERMVRLLEPACDEVVVSVARADESSPWKQIPDTHTNVGPLAGLIAVRDFAQASGFDTIFVTSCDLFGFQTDWVSTLPQATSAFFDDRWQPMVSKWMTADLESLEPKNVGLWRVLETLDARRVQPPATWTDAFSINTPHDYERAKQCLLNHPERYR
ncbi:MAG: molybdenum cofactor guanylyltransferase [bacterium]